ncbi:DoxX family protein [Candidatus Thioglobus sp.]|uniref:DoxX family protein n=1 Tax=Candidatus Thioglobus sp. TaxID=2026721 RepID=UPI003D0C9F96
MLERMNNCPYTLLVGRILLVLIYFIGGLGLLSGSVPIDYAASKGVPELLVWAGFAVKLFAGLAVIVGYQTRIAALALIVFTLATAFIFHDLFGTVFMKEVSMIGGLLVLAATGAGKFSLDGK